MSKLYIYRGVPASGKSTAARAWLEADQKNRARVNRDDIRKSVFGNQFGPNIDEMLVTKIQDATVRSILRSGRDLAVDNMNLRARYVKDLYDIAEEEGAEVEFVDFPIELGEAIRRDLKRSISDGDSHYVGEKALRDIYGRFIRKGQLPEVPERRTPSVISVHQHVDGLPAAIIVDIDGTLAHMTGRSPYDPTLYHMDTFDHTVDGVVRLWRAHHHGGKVIVMSGRNADFRTETEQWLISNDFDHDHLFMRPSLEPNRKDFLVKNDLFEKYIEGRYNVEFTLDDRNSVVDMWRAKGIKCFQVAEGNF